MQLRPLAALLVALTAVGCSSSSSSSSGSSSAAASDTMDMPSHTITTLVHESGLYSETLPRQMAMVVHTRADFERIWSSVHAGRTPVPEPPEIDFARESVVLATLGMRSTGGYSVTIETLEEVPEGMRLVMVEEAPGPDCMVTEALTTPVHLARVRKLPGVVLFEWTKREIGCE